MKKRVLTTLAVVFIAAGLAGCASPAQDTAFAPPAGWSSTPGMFGRLQMWMTGSDSENRQVIMVIRGEKGMTTAELTKTPPFVRTEGMHDVKSDTITICGSQRVAHFTGRGQSGSDSSRVEKQIEGVTTLIGDAKYAVLYIRPVSVRPDAQAEAALRSICPKSS